MSSWKGVAGLKNVPVFTRKEFTTKGADPTVVVRYEHKELGVVIEEFQGCYSLELKHRVMTDESRELVTSLMAALHDALEELNEFKFHTGDPSVERLIKERGVDGHIYDEEKR